MDSQRLISNLAASRFPTDAPALTGRWAQRGRLYTMIQDRARNIGGLVGSGGDAAAEAANAVTRLRNLSDEAAISHKVLRDLTTLFTAVDQRMSEIFEQGARKRLYFARSKIPEVVMQEDEVPRRVLRERFTPITSATQAELVQLIRDDLRPRPQRPGPPEGAQASRAEINQAITHRPADRGRPGLRPPHRSEPEPPLIL